MEGPEEAGEAAHAGGQGLHLCLRQRPPPQLAPKGQAREEAQMLLQHTHVDLALSLHTDEEGDDFKFVHGLLLQCHCTAWLMR